MKNLNYFKCKEHDIQEKEELAKYMADNNFPCYGRCIVGKDFILRFSCSASSYTAFQKVEEFNDSITEKFREAMLIVKQRKDTIFTINSIEKTLEMIGVVEK
jgi:hypothetical protein